MKPLLVSYHGQRVGRLAEAEVGGRTCLFFEYDPAFIRSGVELSPLNLPLRTGLLSRDGARPSPDLPGLFEDSLPDVWGQSIMFDWFRQKGLPVHRVTPLMQLAYVGHRGMGALVYDPEDGPDSAAALDLDAIFAEAAAAEKSAGFTDTLAEVGSSAGGVQPKALVGIATDAGRATFWTGARELPPGFEPWLVKFSVQRPDHPGGDGRVEFAYSLMARAAGIEMPETRLLTAGNHTHFAVRRFDRAGTERIHHHTLARMTQQVGGDLDYELLLRVTAVVTRDHREVVKALRRAVFNVLARNEDDHGKNHGFLFRHGEWKLGPAYDVTFRRLSERGMAVCGERRAASKIHLIQLADRSGISRSVADGIVGEVADAVHRWSHFASEASVPSDIAAEVARELRG